MNLYIPKTEDKSNSVTVECLNIEKKFTFKKENIKYLTKDNNENLLFIEFYNDAISITEDDYNRIIELI